MKTIKITLLSSILIFALVLSFAFVPGIRKSSGETPRNSKKKNVNEKAVVGQWYVYMPGNASMGYAVDPNNYRPLEFWESTMTLCQGNQTICAIFADPNPNNPNIPLINMSTNIHQALNAYFWSGYANPNLIKLKNITED